MSEVCTIKITINEKPEHNFSEEDIVKNLWGHMYPWFTRRHGVTKGQIILEDGAVIVDWLYETNDNDG